MGFEWTFNMHKWPTDRFPESEFGKDVWDTHIYTVWKTTYNMEETMDVFGATRRNCRNSTVAKQEELLWVSGLLLGQSTMRLTPPRRRQTDCESWPCGLRGDSWRGATAVYIGIWMRTTQSGRTSVPRAHTTLIGRAWRSQLGDSTGSQRVAFDLGVCSRDEGSGIVGVYRMYRSRSVVMFFAVRWQS